MYRIIKKEQLNPVVFSMVVAAPAVAKKALPGQFIILRIDERGERIPLTIVGFDRAAGTVRIIFQTVGSTTHRLAGLEEGEAILDFAGPLGKASDLEGIKSAAVVGGGLGVAICYPLARALNETGAELDVVLGFRTKELVFLENEFRSLSGRFFLATDDGSVGEKGFVTSPLSRLLGERKYDVVYAVGPLQMMKNVALLTKEHGQKTVVSMNPIMIDGTGMCGGCRLTVGGEVKFACVDGPEFDAHAVDFDEAIARCAMYAKEERDALCRLMKI